LISAEDVRLLLSYSTFERGSEQKQKRGGLLKEVDEIKLEDRLKDREEIDKFIHFAFGQKHKLTFEDYKNINQNMSSEMLFAMMR
jgi:hypothetical protein